MQILGKYALEAMGFMCYETPKRIYGYTIILKTCLGETYIVPFITRKCAFKLRHFLIEEMGYGKGKIKINKIINIETEGII